VLTTGSGVDVEVGLVAKELGLWSRMSAGSAPPLCLTSSGQVWQADTDNSVCIAVDVFVE